MTIRNAAGSRAAKAKGRQGEQVVCDYLTDKLGHLIERRRLQGEADTGDVAGWDGVVIEVKAEKRINLPGYLAELEAEIEAANTKYGKPHRGCVVVKKRGTTDAGEFYAVVPFRVMVELLR